MKFFTTIEQKLSNFCLLKVKFYYKFTKKDKKIIYIDPGVNELRTSAEYSKVDFMHKLLRENRLQDNEFISIDYPSDMNIQYTDIFKEKSIKNNLLYKDNPKYICTIQYEKNNYTDFVKQFEYLEEQIDFSKKIVGIGNLCQTMYISDFTDKLFNYLLEKPYKFHFYGLALRLIKKYMNNFSTGSVDSCKWLNRSTAELKRKYIYYSTKNSEEFFLSYMNLIKKVINILEY
jgi:hypothetical protein